MANRLTQMEIEEISLVDDPANGDARVVIVKAKGGKDFEPCPGCPNRGACMAKGMCLAKADPVTKFRGTIEGLATDDEDRSVVENAVDELLKALATSGNETATADDEEYSMDLEQLTKSLEDAEAKLTELSKRVEEQDAALAEAQDVIKAKEAELDKAKAKKGYGGKEMMKEDGMDDDEEVMKSLPESIRKRLEETEAKAKEASEQLAKMKNEAETKEAIAKAKDMGFGDAEKVGPLMLRIAKGMTTAEDATLVEQMLKSAAEVSGKSDLFKAIGSDSAVDGDPEALLKAKADEIRKANDKLTPEQAYAAAMDQNPQLYNAYIAKRRV